MTQKALITELNALRSQALEMADKATVLIQQAAATAPASLKNRASRQVIDKINAKIFNKKAGPL